MMRKTKAARPGPRPERAGASRRNVVQTKLADDELEACQRGAERAGETVSEWVRGAILARAKKPSRAR